MQFIKKIRYDPGPHQREYYLLITHFNNSTQNEINSLVYFVNCYLIQSKRERGPSVIYVLI